MVATWLWLAGCSSAVGSGEDGETEAVEATTQELTAAQSVIADAYVRDGGSANRNFGSDGSLVIKNSSSGSNRRIFVRVDLKGATAPVASARLRLYGHYDNTTANASAPLSLFAVASNSWQEAQLTWSNAPSLGTELGTTRVTGSAAYYEWDATSQVNAELARGNKTASFALIAKNRTDSRVLFNAREAASNPPRFELTNATPAPAPAPAPTPAPAPAPTPTPAPTPSASVWRPFSASSPWNTPIASNARVDAQSSAMIADWTTASPFGSFLGINIDQYSVPLYYADAQTPLRTVTAKIGGEGFSGDNGFNAIAQVPVPNDAAPDPQSDRHMLIIDRAHNLEWGFFGAAPQGTQWSCKLCASSNLTGTGVRPPQATNPTWYTSHGPRACGFPLIAGLIRTEEIEAGQIEHALVVAYPHIRAGMYTQPASTAQARIGNDAIKTRGIPCGGRVQLDPNLNLDTLGLSRSGKIIARALQKYGAYVGDFSGSMSLYAENAPAALNYWRGGKLSSGELRNKIDLGAFRVLELGELRDDGNGD